MPKDDAYAVATKLHRILDGDEGGGYGAFANSTTNENEQMYDNYAYQGSASELSNKGESDVTIDYDARAKPKENIDNCQVIYDVEQQRDQNDEQNLRGNKLTRQIYLIQTGAGNFWRTYNTKIWIVIYLVLAGLYFAYFGYAMWYRFGDEGSVRLLVCTVLAVVFIVCRLLLNRFNAQVDEGLDKVKTSWKNINKKKRKRITSGCYYSFIVAFAVFAVVWVIVDVGIKTPRNLIPAAGLAILVLFCFVFSHDPAGVRWRPVILGLYIQFVFALIILRWTFGYEAFSWLGDRVTELLAYSSSGANFMFTTNTFKDLVSTFAFSVLPIIIFFSTLISILFYLGVMQLIIRTIARGMAFFMGTSPAESLNAAANIFIGSTEAPLIFRPFLQYMTNSELHTIMTGGFATIAGSVLGIYIHFGIPSNHLIAASVMSAPAALAIGKLFYPETNKVTASADLIYKMETSYKTERNILEAASNGTSVSIKLIANIAVNLIAFISLLAFLNATLTWFGHRAGVYKPDLNFELGARLGSRIPIGFCVAVVLGVSIVTLTELSELYSVSRDSVMSEWLQTMSQNVLTVSAMCCIARFLLYAVLICSYVFWPLSFIMGVDTADCFDVGELIGLKIFLNEFVAYKRLQGYIGNRYAMEKLNITLEEGALLISPRSTAIATYALCGFSSVSSIGIMLGALGAIVPTRKADLASVVVRAMIAGNIACFLTACIAGLLLEENQK